MTVTNIATIAAGLSRGVENNGAKPANALRTLIANTANNANNKANDNAGISTAITLQNQIAQFRIASQNVAQATSILSAAGAGAVDISGDLSKLKALAARAASFPLSENERILINAQFQALRARINITAGSAKFNDEALLDGSSAQLKVASENAKLKDLSVGGLTDEVLFKGANPNLLTTEDSAEAEALIKEAQTYVNKQIDNIKALQEGLDYTSSTLETAIQNQDAANSTLNEGELLNELLGTSSGSRRLIDGVPASIYAQTNRLPGNILQLLGE